MAYLGHGQTAGIVSQQQQISTKKYVHVIQIPTKLRLLFHWRILLAYLYESLFVIPHSRMENKFVFV